MALLAIGINHKTAPVELREKVAFAPEQMDESLRQLSSLQLVDEAMIVSTCNRTEMYCHVQGDQSDETAAQHISQWLCRTHNISPEQLDPYLYKHHDLNAIQHLLRVSSGLDSLVLGEPQILGQIKSAYQAAKTAQSLGPVLDKLLQHNFAVAKQVRTDTEIGSSPVSVAFAAVNLAKQIYGDLSAYTALMIGAGETIELAARHLNSSGIGRIIIANRTLEKGQNLADEFGGSAIALGDMPQHLHHADIVISSTASQLPILGKGAVENALKIRKHKPMFLVDIAVPRDIEAEVAELDDVYHYTVDDLHDVIQENLKSRQQAAKQAEEIIEQQSDKFVAFLESRAAFDVIAAYRAQAENIKNDSLEKARKMLAAGKSPEQALEFLAHNLSNKLLHTPSAELRRANENGQPELIDAARTLFNLKP